MEKDPEKEKSEDGGTRRKGKGRDLEIEENTTSEKQKTISR